jgi:hypothetical protein
MGQGNCGRKAAALTMIIGVCSPAFGMDKADPPPSVPRSAELNSDGGLIAPPCPTRFDYLVLASFADGASLLTLSSYHFRSADGLSSIALPGS